MQSCLPLGLRVFVYRNLNRTRTDGTPIFSVRASETRYCAGFGDVSYGRVIGYVTQIQLRNCKFIVQPAGNRKVLSSGRKNVHAGVMGTISLDDVAFNPSRTASYHPYEAAFFRGNNGERLDTALAVMIASTTDHTGTPRSHIMVI